MKRLIAVLATLVVTVSLHAEWVPLGPRGGAINVIRVTGSRVYAAGDAGLFVSGDRGATWSTLFNVPDMEFTQLVIDPQSPSTIYVVASQHASYFVRLFTDTRLFKSTDGGLSWRELTRGLPTPKDIADLTIDPASPSVVYAGLQCGVETFKGCPCTDAIPNSGIYKSTDGGETWAPVVTKLPTGAECVRGVTVDPASPNTVYAYSEVLVSSFVVNHLRSTDNGLTWTDTADPSTPSHGLFVHASGRRFALSNPQVTACLYCSEATAVVYSDDGVTWQRVIAGPSINAFAVDPRSDRTVYVARASGLFVTHDLGASFTMLVSGDEWRAARTVVLDPADPTTLYLGTSVGLLVSHDEGGSWNLADVPQNGRTAVAMTIAPDSTIYAVLGDFDVPYEVVRSSDGGATWENLGRLAQQASSSSNTFEPGITAAADGTIFTVIGGLRRLDSSGSRLLTLPANTFASAVLADPQNASVVYVVTNTGLLKSIDRGETWSTLFQGVGMQTIAIAPGPGGALYIGSQSGLFRSTDGGATWTNVHGVPAFRVTVDPKNPATVYIAAGGGNDGWWRSDDSGNTWTKIRNLGANKLVVDPQNSNVLYLMEDGVIRSTDRGATWAPLNSGLTADLVNDLAVDTRANRVYAATFRSGIFVLRNATRHRAVTR